MKGSRRYLAAAAAILIVWAPASALGASIVPPGNSAVNQYTQTVPTSGGNVAIEGEGIAQPSKGLGKKNAHRLEERGPEGKAAAELAAAGAPQTTPVPTPEGESEADDRGGAPGHADNGQGGGPKSANGAGESLGGQPVAVSGGSRSVVGQVLGQASGFTSSSELGLLMPLVLLGGLAWCVAYVLRRKWNTA